MATFTLEDLRQLEKTAALRERLLDHLTVKELPTSARDVEVVTGLADSIDKAIFNRVKINMEEANNKVNEETKEVLRDLLLNLHTSNGIPQPPAAGESQREAPTFQSTGMNVNEGEMIHKQDTADVNQFLEGRQSANEE